MNILIASDGLHAHFYERMTWANAFLACGINVAIWDIKQHSAFDVFDTFNPDLFLGQSYNLDEATIKCIYERPHLKVGLRAGDWGDQTKEIDFNKFNILTCSPKEREILKKLKDETGQPEFVHIHYTQDAISKTHNYFETIGIKPVSIMMSADTVSYGNAKFDPSLECDIGFVGGFWEYKGKVIRPYFFPLLEEVGKYRIKIFGNQPWPANQYCGLINDEDVKNLFVSAKICPNLSEPHAHEFGFDVNERIFKILYAGGFCISDNVVGYRNVFEDGVVYADCPLDFKNKIEFYLNNEEQRKKIADRGNLLVKQKHTGFHRIAQILNEFGYSDLSSELLNQYQEYINAQ